MTQMKVISSNKDQAKSDFEEKYPELLFKYIHATSGLGCWVIYYTKRDRRAKDEAHLEQLINEYNRKHDQEAVLYYP